MLNSTEKKHAKIVTRENYYIFVYIESHKTKKKLFRLKNEHVKLVYLFAIEKFRDVSMWRKKNAIEKNIWEKEWYKSVK